MNILKTTLVPPAVLEWLEQNFPNKLPAGLTTTIEEIRYLQGQQSVIEALRQLNENDE